MHELGVVFHVIESVEDVAKENHIDEIQAVTLQLGEVSTVIPDYLVNCWNWAVKRTEVLKTAVLKIETIPAVTYCEDCGNEYPTVQYGKRCPKCGGEHTYLQQGNEFVIKEIEAVEPDEPDSE
ncbi:MAG: hydrogenase maturation nickel metallochaperone HypA [Lachnospiraceae bacterium]|nr:hydrogenase maturation nickel metallochaperone HypA [Lachnospiraceae bacterium]